jgi:hypothetical protein
MFQQKLFEVVTAEPVKLRIDYRRRISRARATIEETLAGPRAIVGRRLTAPRLRPLIRAGRA